MAKIVYNACHGGFGLSDAAIRRYAEIKGITLYPEKSEYGFVHYWTCSPENRPRLLDGAEFYAASMEDRIASNKAWSDNQLEDRKLERTDPALVQVVEEMGDAANGRAAKLRIEEIPSGTLYRIDEYDGYESVETKETYEWSVAP